MTIAERHKFVLDKLHVQGYITVAEMSKELGVTMVTARKDLNILEKKGLLFRTHGSATLASPYVTDRSLTVKAGIQVDAKKRIAKHAISLINDNDSIIIGSGTTVTFFAQSIPKNFHLTVLTGAINVTLALIDSPDVEVVQLGGLIRKSSASVVGHYSEEMIKDFACSKLIMSVDGLCPEYGLTTSNILEAHLNAAMIRTVQKTIVLTDSSKFGIKSFGKICDLEDVDHIITDKDLSPHYIRELEKKGIDFTIV